MTFYDKSIIYKIKHNEDYDDTNIYIGSTSNFRNRKCKHKSHCNNEQSKQHNVPVYQFIRNNGGWDNWVMIPIEQYSCNSKKELEIRERHHIDLLRPTLNKQMPTRTKKEYYEDNKEYRKEYFKEWYQNNKEQIAEKQKKYNEANKEIIVERKKNHYKANKEKIAEKNKEYRNSNKEKKAERQKLKVICDHCGSEITKYQLNRHQKTKKCIESQKQHISR